MSFPTSLLVSVASAVTTRGPRDDHAVAGGKGKPDLTHILPANTDALLARLQKILAGRRAGPVIDPILAADPDVAGAPKPVAAGPVIGGKGDAYEVPQPVPATDAVLPGPYTLVAWTQSGVKVSGTAPEGTEAQQAWEQQSLVLAFEAMAEVAKGLRVANSAPVAKVDLPVQFKGMAMMVSIRDENLDGKPETICLQMNEGARRLFVVARDVNVFDLAGW
ncbi:MAG: hypothetical protein HY696_04890 [Deltaproteobacteria bacterium]|nr:hypothetical protein [Deltaproteobacteria bacterium]